MGLASLVNKTKVPWWKRMIAGGLVGGVAGAGTGATLRYLARDSAARQLAERRIAALGEGRENGFDDERGDILRQLESEDTLFDKIPFVNNDAQKAFMGLTDEQIKERLGGVLRRGYREGLESVDLPVGQDPTIDNILPFASGLENNIPALENRGRAILDYQR